MSDRKSATVSIKATPEGPTVVVAVPAGTQVERIVGDSDVAAAITRLTGCTACLSGHALQIAEEYGEIIAVDFN